MSMPPTRRARSRATPVLALLLGIAALAIELVRGDTGEGLAFFAIMAGYALLLVVLGDHSEMFSLLRGDDTDERARHLQLCASAITGQVVTVVLVGGFLVEMARGAGDVGLWAGLCAVSGATLIASHAVLRRRS